MWIRKKLKYQVERKHTSLFIKIQLSKAKKHKRVDRGTVVWNFKSLRYWNSSSFSGLCEMKAGAVLGAPVVLVCMLLVPT